jgi:hypothetical protein
MKSPQTGLAEAGRTPSWLLPLVVLFFDVAIVLFALPHEPVRDEAVFFPAARAFAAAGVFPSLELLRHYPAPQAPLSLYLGGRLLAIMPSLRLLRLVDCLLMSGALLCFSRFAARHCGKNAALASALIALNPYFHLVATHFYTDALYFLLVVLVVTRAASRGAWLPLTLLPLVRQLGVVFALAEALQGLVQRRFRAAGAALLTLLPLAALFVLWRGLTPDAPHARTPTSVHHVYGWFLPYVAAYHVSALGFYLAPVAWRIERSRRFWLFGLGFAILYLLAPAHQNFSAQLTNSGITSLGYFHRAALLLGPRAAQMVLLGFAFLGGGLVGEALAVPSAPGFVVLLFVALSAFNFQAWDKYLLDVLPAALIAIFARSKAPNLRRNATAFASDDS